MGEATFSPGKLTFSWAKWLQVNGPASSETQDFKGDGKRRERLGAGKKEEGRGGEGKEERGSPGKLLYTDHFSIEEQTPLARCETEALV